MSGRLRPRARTVLRLCLLTVHGASRLVPPEARNDWRDTWDAELWYRILQLDRTGRLTIRAGAALLHRCLGAYWHAVWVLGRSLAPRTLLAGALVAMRELGAAPAAAGAAVLSLGLALGLGGTVLGVTQAARTRVAVAGQERVVRLWNRAPAAQIGPTGLSSLELRTFRAESPSIEALAAMRRAVVTLGTGLEASAMDAGLVSPEFFETLGVAAQIGRTLEAADFGSERAGASPPVVLDAKLWRERFGGDPAIVGRTAVIDGTPHRVVGVVASGLQMPRAGTRLWLPLGPLSESPGSHEVGAVARLRAGATPKAAERELNRVSRRLQVAVPGGYLGEIGVIWSVMVEPVGGRGPRMARLLALLAAGAALTLVAGIASASSVSATRLGARLGGARALQAVATVAAGAAIGALLVAGTLRALGPWLDGWLPGARTAGALGEALAFVGVGAGAALIAHLAGLRAGHHAVAESRRPRVLRTLLGCAATLAVLAGICAWGYRDLRGSGIGFRTDGLLAVPLDAGSRTIENGWPGRVARLPGVETVSTALATPFVQSLNGVTFVTDESSMGMSRTPMTAVLQLADPAYFGVVGLPLVAGSTFTSPGSGGPGDAPREVVIDASLARRFWPGESPVGRRMRVVMDPMRVTDWLTIVGVAADLHGTAPGESRPSVVYLPVGLDPSAARTLLVRTRLTPDALAAAIAQAGEAVVEPVDLGAAIAARAAPHLAVTLILLVLTGLVALLAATPRILK